MALPFPSAPRRRAAHLLLAAALLLLSPIDAHPQSAGQEVRGFTLPEYDANGNLRRELFGETALLLEGGLMQLSNLRIDFFSQGKLSARAYASECALDQIANRAASRSHIRIVTDNGVLSGDGFAWNGENEQFQIFHNVRVVIDSSNPEISRQLDGPASTEADESSSSSSSTNVVVPEKEAPAP